MNAVFKEFDVINKDNIGNQYFNELLQFAKIQNADDDSDNIMNFIQICYDSSGTFIKTQNYVGLIQLPSGFQIEILPKIYGSENEYDIRKVVVKMLRSLPPFHYKKFGRADLNISKMTLYEVFISIYLRDVLLLVKRGLKSSYVTEEDNLKFFKGKLLFNQHIRHNLSHKERFFVAFDEYNLNRPEHKLIKAALMKLQHKVKDIDNQQLMYRLLANFDFAEASVNYDKDFADVHINRQNKDYEQVMLWTEVFLRNRSFTPFSGQTNTQALLFSMHNLFESYIAQQITIYFTDWKVTKQTSSKYLFDKSMSFKLKPDILLENSGKTIIMDTKWKVLKPKSQDYGISQGDMYQMYVYSKKYNSPEIYLLYPMTETMKDTITYESSDDFTVNIFFVNLFRMEESLIELHNKINELK